MSRALSMSVAFALLFGGRAALAQDAAPPAPAPAPVVPAPAPAPPPPVAPAPAPAAAPAPAPAPAATGGWQPGMTMDQWKQLPDKVRYSVGSPIPPGYERRQLVRKAAVVTGISVAGGAYLTSTLVATAGQEYYPLLIPVVGPFATIFTLGDYATPPGVWFLTVDGLAQGTGVVLLIWGLTDKQEFLVKKPYGFASLQIAPSFGPEHAGVVVHGRF